MISGCGDLAYNTRVANTPVLRASMAESVVIGQTTEQGLTTRWGQPVQKVREGAQIEYIYRDLTDETIGKLFSIGNSTAYVIVTFQYGKAVGVRTSNDEGCRATFPPRPPGHGFSNPMTVYPVMTCPGLYRPSGGGLGAPPIVAESTVTPNKIN